MTIAETQAMQFAADPIEYFGRSRLAMHTLPPGELSALQLQALQTRFQQLRQGVPALRAMAEEQHIDQVESLDDVVALLFPHTVYKSYPTKLLVDGRFDQLTEWLARLTTYDLGGLDAAACTTIDGWLEMVESSTPLRLAHSSGTQGTLSFIPHTQEQYDKLYDIVRLDVLPDQDVDGIDVVWPSFRSGRSGIARQAAAMAAQIGGSPDRLHTLHPGHLSADLIFLLGRMRAATRAGTAPPRADPELLERARDFQAAIRADGDVMAAYVRRLADTLEGRPVVSLSTWDVYSGMATRALDQGLRDVFEPNSMFFAGGGSKAGALPEDWEKRMLRFTGVRALRFCYAMTEVMALNLLCGHDGYHLEPWLSAYVLDPTTGAPMPRAGVQTGRAAFYDLTADAHWGGFVTADRVTIHWDRCACGRTSPRLAGSIRRIADAGGDDKITCASVGETLSTLTQEAG